MPSYCPPANQNVDAKQTLQVDVRASSSSIHSELFEENFDLNESNKHVEDGTDSLLTQEL